MLGIYCRISKDRENQKSIEEQRLRGVAFAEKIDISYNLYIDEGISGGGAKELRPAFDLLIKGVVDKTITAIWVYNQDRAAREESTWHELVNLITDSEIDFYENDKKVDLNDPAEVFNRGVRSSMDAYFKRLTGVKIKNVLDRNIEKGKAWGVLPYGYKTDEDKKLVIAEDEAEIIKKIFELSLSGVGARTIAERLNQLEVPTRYNKYGKGTITVQDKYDFRKKEIKKSDIKWSPNTVRNIILNPIYKGERHRMGKVFQVDSILSAEYWQEVNDNLKRNANNKGRVQSYEYLLKGLLRCGVCGRNYYGRTRANKSDHAYICSSKRIKNHSCGNRGIGIDTLDTIITIYLWSNKDIVRHLESHFKAIPEANEKEVLTKRISTVKKDLKSVNNDIQNMIRLQLKGIVSDEDLQIQNDELKGKQLKEIEKLKKLEKELKNVTNSTIGVQALIDKLEVLDSSIVTEDNEQKVNDYIDERLKSYRVDEMSVSELDELTFYIKDEAERELLSLDIEKLDAVIDYDARKSIIKEIIKNVKIFHDGVDTFFFQINFNAYNTPPFTIAILDTFIKKKGVVYLDDNLTFLRLKVKNHTQYGIWFKRNFDNKLIG